MTTSEYRTWMGYICMNPDCPGTHTKIETHHILKKRLGGPDEAWNYISLCVKCHRTFENHADSNALFVWKSLAEIHKHGFFLEEKEKRRKKIPLAPIEILNEKTRYVRDMKEIVLVIKSLYPPCNIFSIPAEGILENSVNRIGEWIEKKGVVLSDN